MAAPALTNQNNLLLQLKGLSSTEDYLNGMPQRPAPASAVPVTAPVQPTHSVLDMIE